MLWFSRYFLYIVSVFLTCSIIVSDVTQTVAWQRQMCSYILAGILIENVATVVSHFIFNFYGVLLFVVVIVLPSLKYEHDLYYLTHLKKITLTLYFSCDLTRGGTVMKCSLHNCRSLLWLAWAWHRGRRWWGGGRPRRRRERGSPWDRQLLSLPASAHRVLRSHYLFLFLMFSHVNLFLKSCYGWRFKILRKILVLTCHCMYS